MILQDCGFVLGRISRAEPIARALLELLANLHGTLRALDQLDRETRQAT